MGSFIQVPPQDMISLGNALNGIRDMLEAQKNDGRVVHGLDDRHGEYHVQVAEEGFVDAWKTSIDMLIEAIGGTGDLAKAIGVGAAEIDGKVAEAGNNAANQLSSFNFHV
ncbi:hypothetical protein JVX90_01780 [Gordonia sp. PDNC005]|uniref:hypothetical protein n=1 Tax=unclassified Gordonia (in: high G+C Gram-positive bacteria) TaxID=2657482 RepID=UPI00196560B9|nr:hypothetical protein [Gordonia sp. PDNC005]QRY63008.1 hypothetical protein JVX90_01780 [Gordonia sp. PDNC005]